LNRNDNNQATEFSKLAFVASSIDAARDARARLENLYGSVPLDEADAIVALGGDGLMLQTLHQTMQLGTPIYGMHQGSIGFLMNDYREEGLIERLNAAEINVIHPLQMRTLDCEGHRSEALAINEVSLLRQRYQAAKLRIVIDDKVRLELLICDGVLVATPAGSTAYNLSANGPILPLDAPLLALTAISPFRPRRWRGALLPNTACVKIEVLEPDKRPVSAVADHTEIRHVREVRIEERTDIGLRLMFDEGHALDERILVEQFTD
jgi:NAD+ kinase